MFGDWTRDVQSLALQYKTAKPYEHVVIPNFFTTEYAEHLTERFPDPDNTWFKYDNPFEGKYLFNNFDPDDPLKKAIDTLYSQEFLGHVCQITEIPNLVSDPHLNAGGLHAYPRNGISGVHLDYNIHPVSGLERRVSILVYLSKDWKEEWGGRLKVWDPELTTSTEVQHGLWNTAVLFKTNGLTYHGFPEPIKCPEGTFRKAIGIYYLSEPTQEALENPRHHAIYFPAPGTLVNDKMKRLYEIRRERRLEPTDLDDWPTWRQDCGRVD
jgi:2OG-Fe(II) oxygenase superfamily